MKLSYFFALSLLFICPAALARVRMHTHAELKNDPKYGNHTCDLVFEIDAKESLEIFTDEKFKVNAELLSEQDDNATISFTICGKNDTGQWEQISNPVLVPNYTEPALLRLASSQGDSFTLEVDARKI